MNLFETTLKMNGFPIAAAKRKVDDIQKIKENDFKNYVAEARREIVAYHLKNNPFYRNLVGKKEVSVWEHIPILKKRDLQVPLQERLSKGFSLKNVYVNKTSGSSGTPFIFAKDKFCHALTWAVILNRFGGLGIDFNTSLQARFYGIPLDFLGYYKERAKDVFSHRYRFPVFDLSNSKLEKILEVFKKKKFFYLNGYTSSIVLFARFLASKKIILNQVCPSLKYCIVTSEMLFEDDRVLMEEVFGVPIINEYGASELDLIAFTNKENLFSVNSETLFLEILDENDQAVPLGNSGRIILTSLYNKAHPMIRYEIGDTGILDEKSSLKTPILKQLTGRTNDLAKLPSGKTVPGLTFYYVTKSIIQNDGNVKEFVIEQVSLDRFSIKYTSEKELTPADQAKIKKAVFQYLEDDLKIDFERFEVLKRSASGKLKQFVSLVDL